MTAKQLREQRAKLLVDAQTIMRGADVTTEQRTAVDKMLADAQVLLVDAQRIEQVEQLAAEVVAEQRSSGRIPRDNPGAVSDPAIDMRSWQERRSAANRALRTWFSDDPDVSRGFERRDLTVAANGGVMIPVGVTDPKIALKAYGSMYDIVGKMKTATGESVKIPYLNDTTQGFVLASAAITTTDPATGGVTNQVDDIRMNPILIERSLMQDTGFDLVGYIERACSTRYLRTLSNWLTNGNTSNVAAMITGYAAGVTANTTLVTKYVDFLGLLATLDPAYAIGACFVMSNATLYNQVLNILDSQNRPIFLPFNDGGISGFAGTIFGIPVKINPFQPGVGIGNIYIQLGNFEAGYTLREVMAAPDVPGMLPGQGTVMLRRLDERYAELNKVGFVAFARVGGSITNPGSVSASPAPVVALIGK